MIKINSLKDEDVKRAVVYVDGVGNREQGYITSWNDTYVFVDYGHSCGRGIATDPLDLIFMSG
jgi:hypothetical protein